MLEVTISVYKTTVSDVLLFSGNVTKVKGYYAGDKATMKGFEFHTGERIAYGYWNLAKYFAKRLRMGTK